LHATAWTTREKSRRRAARQVTSRFVIILMAKKSSLIFQLKFKGTVRFAPLATHKLQEVGWKDDCESWVYMVVDLIDTRRLPWQELEDREQVQALKEVAMTEPKKLFPEVEASFPHSSIT
jgi:hypothetical protein